MTDRYAARSKKNAEQPLPTRQRMAAGHKLRRKPSTDQKKARRQLARTAMDFDTEFGDMDFSIDDEGFPTDFVFEPQLPSSYGMFTTDGNFAVQEACASVLRENRDWFREWEMGAGAMEAAIEYVCTLVEGPDRMEVWDTAVREAIYGTLTGRKSKALGLEARKVAMEGDGDGQAMGGDSEVLEEETVSEDAIVAARAAILGGKTAAEKLASITCPECGNSGTIGEEDFRGSASNPICTSCGAQFMADGSDPWAKNSSRRTASWIDAARSVLSDGIWDENGKEKLVDGMLLDAYTASGLVQMYDKARPDMQAKLDALPLEKAVSVMWKVVGSKTAASNCACAKNADGTSTTILCPVHADDDPCATVAAVTGKRRKGSIQNGTCTNCGWSSGSKTAANDSIYCSKCKGNEVINRGGVWVNCPKCKGTGLDSRNIDPDIMEMFSSKTASDGGAGMEIANELMRQVIGDPNCSHPRLQAPPKGSLANSVAQCADCGLVMSERTLNEERGQQAMFASRKEAWGQGSVVTLDESELYFFLHDMSNWKSYPADEYSGPSQVLEREVQLKMNHGTGEMFYYQARIALSVHGSWVEGADDGYQWTNNPSYDVSVWIDNIGENSGPAWTGGQSDGKYAETATNSTAIDEGIDWVMQTIDRMVTADKDMAIERRGYLSSKDMNDEEVEGLDTDQTWLDNEEQWQKDAAYSGDDCKQCGGEIDDMEFYQNQHGSFCSQDCEEDWAEDNDVDLDDINATASHDRYGRPIKTHATLSPETDLFL